MDEEMETIVIDGLQWQRAIVAIQSAYPSKPDNRDTRIHLRNISGNNTQFNFSNKDTEVSSFVNSVKLTSLLKPGNQPLQTEGLLINGKQISLNSGKLKLNSGPYEFTNNQTSFVKQVRFEHVSGRDSLSIESPRIGFLTDVNQVLAKNFHITQLDAEALKVRLNKWNNEPKVKSDSTQFPAIRIDRINASRPDIYIASHKNDSVTVVNIPFSDSSKIKASDVTYNNGKLQLNSLVIKTNALTLVKPTGEVIGVEKGIVDLEVSNVLVSTKDNKPSWSGLINNLYLQNPNTLTIGKLKNRLEFKEVAVGNVQLNSDYLANFNQLVKFNVSAWLRSTTGEYIDSITTLKWFNADYNYTDKTLSLDSFLYHPTQPRDSVIAKATRQIDYITFQSGAIRLTDFNLEKYKNDSALFANTISITNPLITIYRDKQPPFLSGIIKPLPVNLIRRISLPVSVSLVNLINGNLSYTERNAKSRAEGTVTLTDFHAAISNIKNRGINFNDSLGLIWNAYLMDSALLALRVKQSYTDSLSGFLMTLKMRPTTLAFLNPVLAPLSNVIITSGKIDSFRLRAIGNENLALGEMNMYYHNLKIKLVPPGEPDKTTFKTRFATFMANTFIIKKNNNGRTGLVYFERLRDRSFFNYLIKMTFRGIATSVGVKKNKKFREQYERELGNRELPSILP
jgi:hypothetical protein